MALANTPGGRPHSWYRGCLPRTAVQRPRRRRPPAPGHIRWAGPIGCPLSRRSQRARARRYRRTGDLRQRPRLRSIAHLVRAGRSQAEDCSQAEDTLASTVVDDLPVSSLRTLRGKLTFVPAGHEYRAWQRARVRSRVICFYFDPAKMPIDADGRSDGSNCACASSKSSAALVP